MTFHIAAAYGIAATAIAALFAMGVQNRRSGWKRERSDTIVGILMAWAEARRDQRNVAAPVPTPAASMAPAVVGPASVASGLSALSAAVGTTADAPVSGAAVAKTEENTANKVA